MAYWVKGGLFLLRNSMSTETVSRTIVSEPSLPEVHSTVRFPARRSTGAGCSGFSGRASSSPSVHGSGQLGHGHRRRFAFGYTLLFVIMASNLMAILLQSLSLKLGVATERDLAQLCNEAYGPQSQLRLWIVRRDRHRRLRPG